MKDRYILEIYEPASRRDVAESVYSDHPFGAIAVGDLFSCKSFSELRMGSVRVAELEHIVWDGDDGAKHKICLYTERVPQ
jgi:hypothetical protein